jgi:hypothetical protein
MTKSQELSREDLERMLSDIDIQPEWRAAADVAADYYDDKQITTEMLAEMEERGQPPLIHNLIKPAINGVLGMEARTRTGWIVRADDEEGTEVAEAINEKLHEAARMAQADRACADAYAGQIKTGMAWVEVSRNSDPFEYPYRVECVNRREIWWDWHSKRADRKDARWLLRRRWLDEDEAIAAFPKHEDLIKQVSNGWQGWTFVEDTHAQSGLVGAHADYMSFGRSLDEWWDSQRRRTLVYEIYYRVKVNSLVLVSPSGLKVEFDKNNLEHKMLALDPRMKLIDGMITKMRCAWYIGPHRIEDKPSPHPHNKFPYVPFIGFTEDTTGVPYGLVRSMIPAQDEINHRRSKLTWLLNVKQVIKDDDATNMSDEQIQEQLSLGDGIVTLNSRRSNKDRNAFRIETEFNIASQQFQIMQEAEKMIQDVAGIYSSFLGQESGAKSGVAINSLVEQGATTLSEINDNYRFARQEVGELLMAHIIEDIGDKPTTVTTNLNDAKRTKHIELNKPDADEQGNKFITNHVMRTKSHVVLDNIQNTPGYHAQLTQRWMDVAQSMPPELAVSIIPVILELSDLPNKEEALKQIRQATGMGVNPDDMSEEEMAAYQQQQKEAQMMKQAQMMKVQGELEELKAKIRTANARAARDEAEAGKVPVDAELVSAQTQKLYAEMERITTEIENMRQTMDVGMDKHIIGLRQPQQQKGLAAG